MPYLDATTDIAFKKLFGDQKRSSLTISFLNSVLGLEEGKRIVAITIMTGENVPLTLDGKRSFLDINCIDQQGRNYIVEVQKQDEGNFLPRAQFYVGNALARQLLQRTDYKDLVPVILVGVVVNFMLFNDFDYLSHHAVANLKTGKQSHFHAEYHYLELKKFTKKEHELTTDLEKWAYLLKHAHELRTIPEEIVTSKELQEACDVLEHGTWNNQDLAIYRKELEYSQREGNIEATAEARGEARGRKEVARQMLAKGLLDAATIAACTGLTLDEIEELRSKRD